MADDFKYDVFISYSSANEDWVRKDLLSTLEKAGLKVCIDFRDFKAGKAMRSRTCVMAFWKAGTRFWY